MRNCWRILQNYSTISLPQTMHRSCCCSTFSPTFDTVSLSKFSSFYWVCHQSTWGLRFPLSSSTIPKCSPCVVKAGSYLLYRVWKGEEDMRVKLFLRKMLFRKCPYPFHCQSVGQAAVARPHVAVREAAKCDFYLGSHLCFYNPGVMKKKEKNRYFKKIAILLHFWNMLQLGSFHLSF